MVYKKEYYGHSGTKVEKYYDGILLHREDGPATVWYDRDGRILQEYYYQLDELHRLDGPATIRYNENGDIAHQSYWIRGRCYEDVFLYSVEVGSLKGE